MSILVVDDSSSQRVLLYHLLTAGGFADVLLADSAVKAIEILRIDNPKHCTEVDLILMDILMPDVNGIEACRLIKATDHLKDIPIIMVTGITEMENLELAFACGAMDYIVKPVNKIELLARVGSLLRLKHEMDKRKDRERELIEVTRQLREANRMLQRLSLLDGLTGIANRRYFEEYYDREWKNALRDKKPLSLLLIDIDHFKPFNDTYGHQYGDECLRQVAKALGKVVGRPRDFVGRYGGEEFAAILPDTDINGALLLARMMCTKVSELGIAHASSGVCTVVTVSIGVASITPKPGIESSTLVSATDSALYEAKREGRNRVSWKALDLERVRLF